VAGQADRAHLGDLARRALAARRAGVACRASGVNLAAVERARLRTSVRASAAWRWRE